MNSITHALVGLMLSQAFMLPVTPLFFGAVGPDLDYLVGLTHRGVTHSLLFVIVCSMLALRFKGKRWALALFIGLSSHLMLDSLTLQGIPLLWPLDTYFGLGLVSSSDWFSNTLFIALSIIILINKVSVNDYFISLRPGILLKSVLGLTLGFFITLLFLPPLNKCVGESTLINQVLTRPSESLVSVTGFICSNVSLYEAVSGNEYQVFDLCDDSGNISVWKNFWVLENNLSKGDVVSLCGDFTMKYSKPEVYFVREVIK